MIEVTCFICKSPAQGASINGNDVCNCPKCGNYKFSSTASAVLDNGNLTNRQRANISGWLRENQGLIITSEHVGMLKSLQSPTVAERAFKILQAMGHKCQYMGAAVDPLSDEFIGVSWSVNYDELAYLVNRFLDAEMQYIKFDFIDTASITPKGYAALEEAKQINADSQIGFCAMWFGSEVLPAWTEAILPAIVASGYEAKRIDTHDHNNRIDDEIIAMLRKSKFVVADFTGQRGGVYFEAGFALGMGLPVIWTVRRDSLHDVHFDNRQYNFVVWEQDKLGAFKTSLQNRIEATLGRGKLSA
ncbi:hypothetical protein [Methylophilus sp. 5]|uniref:hypothetical protein n=1 Tax=Methylophilus sp. 5 TaxID=1112274 RepID=UPI0004AF3051|nr:hypothetical protein [Methylophilus sp. 5]